MSPYFLCSLSRLRHAIAGLLLLILAIPQSQAAEKVVFATDWKAQAEHGGFYQALAKGFYAKHGLDVTIRQGGPQTNTSQLIASGAVDLAMGSNGFFVLNFIQAGAPVKAVMASFQKEPTVLITHPDDTIHGIADLKGRPILLSKDSLTALWPWLKQKYGFTDAQIRPYTFNLAPFLVDKTVVQEGYLGSEPFQIIKEGGFTPKVFLLSDNGYPGYAALVLARQELIERKPQLVQAFVDATIEGWRDYLNGDPAPGNALIKANNPEMTDDVIAYGISAMKQYGIVQGSDAAHQDIGIMTDRRWDEFASQAIALGLAPKTLDIRSGYTLRFLSPAGAASHP